MHFYAGEGQRLPRNYHGVIATRQSYLLHTDNRSRCWGSLEKEETNLRKGEGGRTDGRMRDLSMQRWEGLEKLSREHPQGLQVIFTTGLIILGDKGAEPWVRGPDGASWGSSETFWSCPGLSLCVTERVGDFPSASDELSL